MNIWSNTILTDKGRALMAKLTQGTSLDITRAATGAGFVTPGLLTKATSITDPKQELSFKPVAYPETGKCAITVALKNEGVDTGYTATQVGLFATDPDEGEILLLISQASDATSGTIVPSATEMPGFSSEWTFYLQYGQADGVNVSVDPSNTVTREEMQDYVMGIGKRTARVTVGTSTNGCTKENCNFLCDGTNDGATINAAINSLPDTGGEVVLLDGTYKINAKIYIKDNVTLRGNGSRTVLERAFYYSAVINISGITGNNITILDLVIDGNKTAYSEGRNDGIDLMFDGDKYCVIKNVTVKDCTGAGIKITSDNAIISNNSVFGNGTGIYIDSIGGRNCIVTENFCDGNEYGISSNAMLATISGNIISNSKYVGLLSQGENNSITGNVCTNNGSDIEVILGMENIIAGNILRSTQALYLSAESRDNTIGNNDIGAGKVFDDGTNNEWATPPMEQGIEYRTTERWKGEAVYVVLADDGIVHKRTESEGDITPITIGADDLEAGVSALRTGALYFVYE